MKKEWHRLMKPQVGGSHYQKPIEPIDYILANQLGPCEANVVKYITRWLDKDGVDDLDKAAQYIAFLRADATAHPEKYGLQPAPDAGSPTLTDAYLDNRWGEEGEA